MISPSKLLPIFASSLLATTQSFRRSSTRAITKLTVKQRKKRATAKRAKKARKIQRKHAK